MVRRLPFSPPQLRTALAPMLGAFAVSTACTSEQTPPVVPPDRTSDTAVFEEKALALTMDRGDLVVDVPIGNPGLRTVAGSIKLSLIDLTGARLATAAERFEAPPGGTTATLTLDRLPADTTEADLAAYLVKYEIDWGTGRATGARSAFDALEKL